MCQRIHRHPIARWSRPNLLANGNQHAARSNRHQNPNHPRSGAYPGGDTHPRAFQDPGDCNPDPNPNTSPSPYTHPYSHCYSISHGHPDTDPGTYGHGAAHSDTQANPHTSSHSHGPADSYA